MFIVYLIVAVSLGYLGINAAEMYVQVLCISGMAYCMFTVGREIQKGIDMLYAKQMLREAFEYYTQKEEATKIYYEKMLNKNTNPPGNIH